MKIHRAVLVLAATAAAIEKQELEQGQKTLEQSRQKIEQAVQAQQRQVPD